MTTTDALVESPDSTAADLAEVLADVLGMDEVSPHSHFFDDLGADSMLMARFCARARKRDDLPTIAMRDIYRHPTIDSLVTSLGAAEPATALAPTPTPAPAPDTATRLAEVLAGVLKVDHVDLCSDFFDDLGADSLVMAQFCARVRKREDLPTIAMRDVYQHPSIDRLVTAFGDTALPTPVVTLAPTVPTTTATSTPTTATSASTMLSGDAPPEPRRARRGAYTMCGIAQLLAFVAYSWLNLLIMVKSYEWITLGTDLLDFYRRSFTVGALTFLALCLLPIAVKWLLVGRWRPQAFPVWSLAYLRFWIVKTAIWSSPMALLFLGTPLYAAYLRLLGAKVGRGAIIFSRLPVCTDLVTIGAGTVIRKDALLSGYRARDGVIEIGPVSIGRDAFVGEVAVLDIHTSMGDGAQIGHASSLHPGQHIPSGESWHGTPARPAGVSYRARPSVPYRRWRAPVYTAWQVLTLTFVGLPLVYGFAEVILATSQVAPLLHPEIVHVTSGLFYLDAALISLAFFVGTLLLGLVIVGTVPRVLNLALAPGRDWPLYGVRYTLHRTVERMTNVKALTMLFGDSSFIVHYLGAIGWRLRPVQQTGTNFGQDVKHENPFLCSVGTGTVIADGLSIVNAEYSDNSFRLSRTHIGARSFLGNNIVYPAGGRTGDDVLLGTKVMIPLDGPVRQGVGLLGSPSFEIPRTVRRDAALELRDAELLDRQLRSKTAHNIATMGHYLGVRWLFTYGIFIIIGLTTDLYYLVGAGTLALFSALTLLYSLVFWTVVQRCYNGLLAMAPRGLSIYDRAFWRHERFWKVPSPAYLLAMSGTPFKGVLWRAAGVRVGRRLFDDGAGLVEKTTVTIGDECTLNAGAVIQCHSQEDGAFKSDRVSVGNRCTLGVGSFVHYGTTIGDGADLTADAFLMKGEEIPAGQRWEGNPAHETDDPPVTTTTGHAGLTTSRG